MKVQQLHQIFLKSEGISTDSRENLKNKLFFALKGESFDGNKFAEKAIEDGALYAIVDDSTVAKRNASFILVKNVLKTLQDLAVYHRKYLALPIIGITGSNGKTTTKELIAAVLSQHYKVSFTQGNLNNHIGVPLTLLSMDKNTEIGIVEMGANHQKEIESLCRIAHPDYGYITNFGKAHLEGFGSFEGVIKGKSELYDCLRENDAKIFVNADDELQLKQSSGGDRILFGTANSPSLACVITSEPSSSFVKVNYKNSEIESRLLGDYNAKNISAAICIGDYFDLNAAQIKKGIEEYKPENNRSQIIEKEEYKIILDAYNANPTSMNLALQNFEKYKADYKVVFLGDMFEIGKTALKEHQAIVNQLEESTINKAFVCGKMFAQTQTEKVKAFKTYEALQTELKRQKLPTSFILIKGSRGMAMERILEEL